MAFRYLRPSTRGKGEHPLAPLSSGELSGDGAVRLLFLGDLMAARDWRLPEVSPRFGELVRRADLVIANCEGPVTPGRVPDPRRPYHRVRFSEEYLGRLLRRLGADPGKWLLSVANNHAGDCGRQGLWRTVEALRGLGVGVVGARTGASPVVRADVGGLSVGFAAWTHWQNRKELAGALDVWNAEELGARRWRDDIRQSGVRCLAALPHWDFEFGHFPRPAVRRLAGELAAAGFGIIAGHHPHVVQPLQLFDGGLCLYSGGNVIGPAIRVSWPCRLFVGLEVSLAAAGPNAGKVGGYRVHPFVQLQPGWRPRILSPPEWPRRLDAGLQRRLGLLFDVRGN